MITEPTEAPPTTDVALIYRMWQAGKASYADVIELENRLMATRGGQHQPPVIDWRETNEGDYQ